MRQTVLSSLAALGLLVTVAGCDTVASKLGLDKVDIGLGSAGAALAVSPTPSAKEANVTANTSDLPDVFDVESIQFNNADLRFTPSAAGKTAQSGEITLAVLINGFPAIFGKVLVVNNVVTGTQPDVNKIGQFDAATKTAIRNLVNQLPSPRPTVSDFEGKTADQIVDLVNTALKSGNFKIALMVVSSNVTGTLSVDKARFNLDF